MNIEIKKSIKPVNYFDAINLMEARLQQILDKKEKQLIWTLKHNKIYTAGTSFNKNEIIDKSIKLLKLIVVEKLLVTHQDNWFVILS